jgi:hypothetical protein
MGCARWSRTGFQNPVDKVRFLSTAAIAPNRDDPTRTSQVRLLYDRLNRPLARCQILLVRITI